MAVPFERIVAEDINLGYGTQAVTMPAGGTATGNKIGVHTLLPAVWNVKDFGAVGDGIADDAAAIRATIAVAVANGRGVVYVPPGTYIIGSKLAIVASNIVLSGAGGNASILQLKANVNDHLIEVGDGSTYVTGNHIEGLHLRGTSASQSSGSGIHDYSAERTAIVGCHIYDFKDRGIWGEGTVTRNQLYLTVRNCYVNTNLGDGIRLTNQCYTARIIGNIIAGNGKSPAGAFGINAILNDTHQIVGNTFDENSYGIQLYGCSEVTIGTNIFENQDRSGIVLTNAATRNVIIGNTIRDPSTGTANTYAGIDITGDKNAVTGNVIGGINVVVSDGINVRAGSTKCSLVGNIITGTVTNPITDAGTTTTKSANTT